MSKIHIVLQGKGGVGKSVAAAILAQFKVEMGKPAVCIDTDPVNATFHGYQALHVKRLQIMEGEEIDPRKFDALVEMIAATDSDVIVDNGATSFVPLSHFLITNQVPSLLVDMGRELVVHTIVTGGQALFDTINGFAQLINQFPSEALFVVWLNPFWGVIEHEGKSFEQMKAYVSSKQRVAAIVQLPTLKKETYGRDLSDMLMRRQTFDEALAMESLTIMTRQRLKIIKRQIFGELEKATVL